MAIGPYSDPFYITLVSHIGPFSDPFYVDTSTVPASFILPFSDPFYVDTSVEPLEWGIVVAGVITPARMNAVRDP